MSNIVTIDQNACKGCGLCISVCPKKVLELDRTVLNEKGYNPTAAVNQSACIGCTMCGMICPDSVITVERGVSV